MITALLAGLLLSPSAAAQADYDYYSPFVGYHPTHSEGIGVKISPEGAQICLAALGGTVIAVLAAPAVIAAAGSMTTATVVETSTLATGMGLTVGEVIVLEETVLAPALDACIDTITDLAFDETEALLDGGETPDLPPTGGQPNPGGCEHPWEGLRGILIADPTSPHGLSTFGFEPHAEWPRDAVDLGIAITVDCEGNVIPFQVK